MQVKIKVIKVFPTREGQSERGPWAFTPVCISWEEESFNGKFDQSVVAEFSGKPSNNLLMLLMSGERIEAKVFFEAKQGVKNPETMFNSVRVILPKDFIVSNN